MTTRAMVTVTVWRSEAMSDARTFTVGEFEEGDIPARIADVAGRMTRQLLAGAEAFDPSDTLPLLPPGMVPTTLWDPEEVAACLD